MTSESNIWIGNANSVAMSRMNFANKLSGSLCGARVGPACGAFSCMLDSVGLLNGYTFSCGNAGTTSDTADSLSGQPLWYRFESWARADHSMDARAASAMVNSFGSNWRPNWRWTDVRDRARGSALCSRCCLLEGVPESK